jgi:membrane protease subunit (stomatin/prohibitin family)
MPGVIVRDAVEKDQLLSSRPRRDLSPNITVRVGPGEEAVFRRHGLGVGSLGPGEHKLNVDAIAFLALLKEGDRFDAELWFVRTAPTSVRFGFDVGVVADGPTGVVSHPRAMGVATLHCTDTQQLIGELPSNPSDINVPEWISEPLRDAIQEQFQLGTHSISEVLRGNSASLLELVLPGVNSRLQRLALEVTGFTSFSLELDAESKRQFQANGITPGTTPPKPVAPKPTAVPTTSAPSANAGVTIRCSSCGANVPSGRFCQRCGKSLSKPCATCGSDLAPDAKFCARCGALAAVVTGMLKL